jgi:hypothetical protein
VPRNGRLGGAGECIWIDIDRVRASALWPRGFTASAGPIVVYDADGGAIARDGEVLTAVMLGPTRLDGPDECGLTDVIDVFWPTPGASVADRPARG